MAAITSLLLAGCGATGGGSCDTRPLMAQQKDAHYVTCTDYHATTGPVALGVEGSQQVCMAAGATWSGGSCDHTGAVVGCADANNVSVIWYYPGPAHMANDTQPTCMSNQTVVKS